MGRTNPTFRNVVTGYEERWRDYHRALRREDQPHFERLFEHARAHADAAGYLNHDDPYVPILMSIALEQEVRIAALADRVATLETALDRDRDDGSGDDSDAVPAPRDAD